MADNFNMKQFLAENKLGAYSRLKEENVEEAKIVFKDKKIQVIKEWIWFTCDEGQAKNDINKYNKMVDIYFADKDDVTKEDFEKIWSKVTEKYGVGDVGADWEAFDETWRDVQKGRLVNPKMKYEGEAAYEYEKGKAAGEKEEKAKLQKEDADTQAEKMMDFLAEYEVIYVVQNGRCYRKDDEGNMDEVDMSKCRQYAEGKKEKEEGITEENDYLPPSATERMDGLVLQPALKALVAGAQAIIRDFKEEGYEDDEIYNYIVSKIKTLG